MFNNETSLHLVIVKLGMCMYRTFELFHGILRHINVIQCYFLSPSWGLLHGCSQGLIQNDICKCLGNWIMGPCRTSEQNTVRKSVSSLNPSNRPPVRFLGSFYLLKSHLQFFPNSNARSRCHLQWCLLIRVPSMDIGAVFTQKSHQLRITI